MIAINVQIFFDKGNYEPGCSKCIELLLRRTLVLKNSCELLAARHEQMFEAHSSLLVAPKVQVSDTTGDAICTTARNINITMHTFTTLLIAVTHCTFATLYGRSF